MIPKMELTKIEDKMKSNRSERPLIKYRDRWKAILCVGKEHTKKTKIESHLEMYGQREGESGGRKPGDEKRKRIEATN